MSWSSDDVMNRATMFEAAAICYPDNDYEADYGSTGACQQAFIAGAEWFAAGMAVCAFLEDLARLRASPPPVSSDDVKKHCSTRLRHSQPQCAGHGGEP